jgi:hypothetical protein
MITSTVDNPLTFAKTEDLTSFVAETFKGKMTPGKLDAVLDALKATSPAQKIYASASVGGALFWCKFTLECQGRYFDHSAWGGGTLGGGFVWGDLYTDNLAKCFSDTRSFSLSVAGVAVLATFHAADSTLLATFISGGAVVPPLWFEGGSSGGWS